MTGASCFNIDLEMTTTTHNIAQQPPKDTVLILDFWGTLIYSLSQMPQNPNFA